jgi:hypothetical protein
MRLALGIAIIAFATSCTIVHASSDVAANVRVVELRQTDASLHETYAKGKKIFLPRMAMLDAEGRLLYGGFGMRNDLHRQLHKAYDAGKPIDSPITLRAILDETERADGTRLRTSDLPKADIYIVDYWAEWCAPCRMMSRDLESEMRRWNDKQFVWIKIESDPDKMSKQP